VYAQLTAAAGLVNGLEGRVKLLRLGLERQQRREALLAELAALLPLLRQLQSIKVRGGRARPCLPLPPSAAPASCPPPGWAPPC
jgi:hypothetical protein